MDDAGYLAPFMFLSLFLLLLTGYPVAFVLGAVALIFGLIGIWLEVIPFSLAYAVPDRLFGIMRNDTLLAIPFFTLMGLILERSGIAEQLLSSMGRLMGRVRGGLALSVVIVGTLLAATTGVVAASVMAMGLIALPIMLRQGYSPALSSGVIMASGTLAQILPPSLVLIVLADTLGAPVGDMFIGAMLPSMLLVGMFAAFILITAQLKPALFPVITPLEPINWGAIAHSMVPALLLIVLVLGSIFIGVATPTEAGAIGAVCALILALIKRKLSRGNLSAALQQTARLTCFVMFILIGSSLFGLVFRALGGDLWVVDLFNQLPGGVIGFLLMVNLIIFILGFFLDFFEIVFIVVPLLVPLLHQFGLDPVWFGVILAMNLQTSFLTPPCGFSLFYLKSVAPASLTSQAIHRGVIPFIILQLLMVAILIKFPQLVLTKSSNFADIEQSPTQQLAGLEGTSHADAIRLMLQIAEEQRESTAQGATP
ncbi:MAG: TRAP transporter large permease subunit [Pseudomonadota bacterium]|nr:TRAP transporter large permease subunit [Pseudomonadota bacterium]